MAERELPNSPTAEASVLSILLNDKDGAKTNTALVSGLRPAMFFTPKYKLIAAAVFKLYAEGKPIDSTGVCDLLRARGFLEKVGGEKAVLELSERKDIDVNLDYYVEIVKDKDFRRKLAKKTIKAVEANFPDSVANQEIADAINNMFLTAGKNITAEGVAEARACRELVRKKLWELFTDARGCGFSLHGTLRLLTRLVERLNRRARGE